MAISCQSAWDRYDRDACAMHDANQGPEPAATASIAFDATSFLNRRHPDGGRPYSGKPGVGTHELQFCCRHLSGCSATSAWLQDLERKPKEYNGTVHLACGGAVRWSGNSARPPVADQGRAHSPQCTCFFHYVVQRLGLTILIDDEHLVDIQELISRLNLEGLVERYVTQRFVSIPHRILKLNVGG